MGLRSTAGTMRAFPTLGRRTFAAEQRLDGVEQRLDDVGAELGELRRAVADHAATLVELQRRATAAEVLLEQVQQQLRSADPQATMAIVAAVQQQVTSIGTEVTEQLNRTSDVLASLEA
jgi:predicted  nucleic acid-binding Zn-ribbon protein